MLDTPTWRASPRWAAELGISDDELDRLNRRGVAFIEQLRDAWSERVDGPIVLAGCSAPRTTATNRISC